MKRPAAAAAGLLVAVLAGEPAAHSLERPESANPAQNYLLFCGGCHGIAGSGVAQKVPPLRGSVGRFLHISGGRELLLRFPGVSNSQLSDHGLAEVMNWCLAEFAAADRPSDFRPYTAAEVHEARAEPALNVQRLRRELLERGGLNSSKAADY